MPCYREPGLAQVSALNLGLLEGSGLGLQTVDSS